MHDMLTKVPTSTMTTATVSLKFECVGAEQPSLMMCSQSPHLNDDNASCQSVSILNVQVLSKPPSQGLLFSGAIKPYAEAVGQTGAQGLVRGCGPHCPPVSRKNPARDEASGAPRAGRGSASFSGLISGVRVLSPALSGGRPGFRGYPHLDRPAAQASHGRRDKQKAVNFFLIIAHAANG